jgi:hypothetical protein
LRGQFRHRFNVRVVASNVDAKRRELRAHTLNGLLEPLDFEIAFIHVVGVLRLVRRRRGWRPIFPTLKHRPADENFFTFGMRRGSDDLPGSTTSVSP